MPLAERKCYSRSALMPVLDLGGLDRRTQVVVWALSLIAPTLVYSQTWNCSPYHTVPANVLCPFYNHGTNSFRHALWQAFS